MEVCGVDPGLAITGYAILALNGESTVICDAGVCRTDADAPLTERLIQLESDFTGVLEQWNPCVMGVEQLYAHYKHPRTAILMGHARGVILAVAGRFGVRVKDISATQVKRHLTGNGRASKTQIQRAIQVELALDSLPEPNDVADALAVALCCARLLRAERVEAAGP